MSTPAHTQKVTLHFEQWYPTHEARENDPHYAAFHACREKLRKAGKLICWVCGQDEHAADAPIELHHDRIEYSLQNGVDIEKFEEAFPDLNVHDEESFFAFVEGPLNLTPLCKLHHTGHLGVHVLPAPVWNVLKIWKDDLPAPVRPL
jgi:hypothetical protein